MDTGRAPPSVEEIRPHLWRICLPHQGHSVGHVNVYALEAADGIVLVDAGWYSRDTLRGLELGLSSLGAEILDVQGVIATHYHADHVGLAGYIQRMSGAWVALHEADARLIDERYYAFRRYQVAFDQWCREVHSTSLVRSDAMDQCRRQSRRMARVSIDRPLAEGNSIQHGKWNLEVVETPGHTPGHVCLYDEGEKILFTGDHVFSRINTGPTYRPQALKDSVRYYTNSLARISKLEVLDALPGHQEPISDLPSRVLELIRYHDERTDEVVSLVESGHTVVWDVSRLVRRSRSWEGLQPRSKISALAETYAHLQRAEASGRLYATTSVPVYWSLS